MMNSENDNIVKLSGIECFWCKSKHLDKVSNDKYVCKSCSNVNYRLTDEYNMKYITACTAMENYHFSYAYNIYHNLYMQTNEPKFKAQAIFGMLKATYGIIYIESNYVYNGEKVKKKVATFSNYNKVTKSLLDTDYYKKIKELNFDEKDKFLNEIKKLDKYFKEIIEILDSDTIYDVFICVKISSLIDRTSNTQDYTDYALDIYDKLTKDGLKVFCSHVNKVSEDPEVFAALAKSKVMLVISKSKEHLESEWVQSEWRRWLNFIDIGVKDNYSLLALFPNDSMVVPPTFSDKNINIFRDKMDIYKKITDLFSDKVALDKNEHIKPLEPTKKKKNIFIYLFLVVLFIAILIVSINSLFIVEQENEEFKYKIINNEITLISQNENSEIVKIPNELEIDEKIYKVTNVESTFFLNMTEVYEDMFNNNYNLEKISFPESIVIINENAFRDCVNLKTILFNDNLKIIEKNAFYNCDSLSKVILPSKVKEINDHAFAECDNLETINLPNSIITIGKSVFEDCISLEEIIIPERATLPSLHPQNNYCTL